MGGTSPESSGGGGRLLGRTLKKAVRSEIMDARTNLKGRPPQGASKKTAVIMENGCFLLVAVLYFACSIGLTFYQKSVIKVLPYPLTIVLCHLIFKFIVAATCRTLWSFWTKESRVFLGWGVYLRKLPAIAFCSAYDIGASQLSLEFVTVAFYTIVKTSSTPFILMFALCYNLEKKSCSLISTIGLIFLGLLLFTYKSTTISWFGGLLLLSAAMVSGLRWTYTQIVMQKGTRKDLGLSNPVDMIFHVQPFMILFLTPVVGIVEGEQFAASAHGLRAHSLEDFAHTFYLIIAGGIIAFLMETAEFAVVCKGSSLSLAITGVIKDIAMIMFSVMFRGEELSKMNWLGCVVIFIGIILHIIRKHKTVAERNYDFEDSDDDDDDDDEYDEVDRVMRRPTFRNNREKKETEKNKKGGFRGSSLPLLSDSDFSSEDDEIFTNGSLPRTKTFKEMDEDFLLRDNRAWTSVKDSHLEMPGLSSASSPQLQSKEDDKKLIEGFEELNFLSD